MCYACGADGRSVERRADKGWAANGALRSSFKVSVKKNEVPAEKNSSRASIFATMASYISN